MPKALNCIRNCFFFIKYQEYNKEIVFQIAKIVFII